MSLAFPYRTVRYGKAKDIRLHGELFSPPRNERRRPIKIYYKLAQAQKNCISANDRIWL